MSSLSYLNRLDGLSFGEILDDVPLINYFSSWNAEILIFESVSSDGDSAVTVLFAYFHRPLGSRFHEFSVSECSSSPLNHIDWIVRIHIMCLIGSLLHGFTFESGPTSLIIMHVASLNDVNFVLID